MSPEGGGGLFFWGGGGGGRGHTVFKRKRGGQPLLTGTKGGPGEKGENYLKRWDQFITF